MERRRSNVGRLALGVLLLLILMFGSSFVALQSLHDSNRWVAHTEAVRTAIARAEGLLTDAESGQRGFLLTENPLYLDPFVRAERELPGALLALRQLSGNRAQESAQLDTLSHLVVQKLAELKRTIDLVQKGQAAAAHAIVATNEGRRLMVAAKQQFVALEGEELQLLARRTKRSELIHRVTLALSGVESVMLLIVGGMLYRLTRDLLARQELERLLTAERDRLKRGEQEIEAAKHELEELVETMPQLAWWADPDGSIRFFNQRWFAYTGTTLEQMQGWGWKSVHDPEMIEELTGHWQAALAAGTLFESEVRLRRADGAMRWFLTRAQPLRDRQGKIVRWSGTSTDIDDQKSAIEEAARRAGQLATVTAVALAFNQGGELRAILDRCCGAVAEQLGAAFARIWTLAPDGVTLELQASAGLYTHLDGKHARIPVGALKIGLVASERVAHLSNDVAHDPRVGDPAWAERHGLVSFAGFPLLSGGRVLGVLAAFGTRPFLSDTIETLATLSNMIAVGIERQRAREQVLRERTALASSNQELDQFAYVASHDLKAPLRAIANLSQWIEEDLAERMTDEARGQMKLLRGRVHRMEALIEGILDYSRAGRVKVEATEVAVGKLLGEVIDLLAPPPSVTIEVGPKMPLFKTDRVPLQQMFLNLIGNAIKYSRRPDVHVAVEVKDAGWFYDFAVSDNGPGIEPKYQERIWGVFQTLESRDKDEGTGIGLSVVKKMAENRGGRAWVESTPGQGATFHFLWPKIDSRGIVHE